MDECLNLHGLTLYDSLIKAYIGAVSGGANSVRILTLSLAPTSSTITYTIDNNAYNFKIGDEVRVPDGDGGYLYYKLYNLTTSGNTTTASWEKLGSNSDAALLGDPDGTAFSADFDPQTDTVWNKAQVLTSAQKAQVRLNLGLLDIVFNTAYDPVNNKAATMDDIPQSLPANGGNAATVNNHSVQSDVPANAVFTDTTYVFNTAYNETTNKAATMADIPGDATQSEAGLMSAADKTKLDNTKNITVSSSDPTSGDGLDGDIWFVYDAS